MVGNILDLPLELVHCISREMDYPSLLAMRTVCKATKHWVEKSALNVVKEPLIRCLKMTKEGNAVKTEIFVDQEDEANHLETRAYIVCDLGHGNIDEFAFTTTSIETALILDRLSSITTKIKCATAEFQPSTEEIFDLASKFFEGKQLNCVALHIADSELSKSRLSPPVVCVHLTAGVLEYGAFLVNLAAIVDGIKCFAPAVVKNEPFSDWAALQNLALEVLSSSCCCYFNIVHAFARIPMNEADNLATALSRVQHKKFFFGARTSEKRPRTANNNNIPVVLEMWSTIDGPVVEMIRT